MSKAGRVTDWLMENKHLASDKETFVTGAMKAFPASTRKSILNRIADLVHRGDLPSGLIGRKGGARLPKTSGGKGEAKGTAGKKPKKNGGKKVPKKFRMAVDANLVRDEWDDEAKIDEGLENLGGQVIKDNDFRTELGIAQDRWKLVSMSEKYTANKIDLKGKTYKGTFWGQKETIKSLQKKVDMV